MADVAGYPERWEADVVLADGATVHLRPIRPRDAERLVAFHGRQSAESIYYRFFSARPRLSDKEVERFTHVDYVDRMAFVALLGDDLIGVSRYDRTPGRPVAEVAFFIDDRHHGRGLATLMLEYLAAAAREQGITRFTAQTLPQNRKMLGVFKSAGFDVSTRFDEGIIEVDMGILPTDAALAAIDERERRAEARSVARLLSPRSIAVVGAGRRRGGLGHEVFRNLIAHGFNGPVHPINAHAPHVASVRTHPSVLDVPGDVDLAVVAVPAPEVPAVVRECAQKGVGGLIVISAGFAETGPDGAAAQRELVELARRHGMRLVGPNCMGLINTAPTVSMQATFAPVGPAPGGVALLSQSGTLGTAILEAAGELGVGISTFVSLGNKADVSANDLLQFWEGDERTDVVQLYMESFGNLRKFSRIARRVSRTKPVVSVTSGIGALGADDPDLPADTTLDAVLRQIGVIRVSTIERMFDVTRVLSTQPVPRGRRVALVSNSTGPARLALDACQGAGLDHARLGDDTREALRRALPDATHVDSPLDLTHEAGPAEYEAAVRLVLADPGVDAVIAIFAPPLEVRTEGVARAIAAAAGPVDKPVVATYLGVDPRRGIGADPAVPAFAFPEEAARALGPVAAYGEWLIRPEGTVPVFDDVDPDAARDAVGAALEDAPEGRLLDHDRALAVLATFGIHPVDQARAGSAEEAVAAAEGIGWPVVLKATGLERLAKTEAGGLAIDLFDAEELRHSYARMETSLGDAMHPALVQAMAPPGTDVAIRLVQSPAVGSVISLGIGGAVADQVGFDALRVLPLTDLDADRLVDASRVAVDLPPGPARDRLGDLLLRLAALAEAVPEIAEVRLNPVIVSAAAAAVTDVAIRVAPWAVRDEPVRRLEPE
jgi:acyl-CoA synthetase (NDP forming)/RimJ/RimL family protein N-acetyltransferase